MFLVWLVKTLFWVQRIRLQMAMGFLLQTWNTLSASKFCNKWEDVLQGISIH